MKILTNVARAADDADNVEIIVTADHPHFHVAIYDSQFELVYSDGNVPLDSDFFPPGFYLARCTFWGPTGAKAELKILTAAKSGEASGRIDQSQTEGRIATNFTVN